MPVQVCLAALALCIRGLNQQHGLQEAAEGQIEKAPAADAGHSRTQQTVLCGLQRIREGITLNLMASQRSAQRL